MTVLYGLFRIKIFEYQSISIQIHWKGYEKLIGVLLGLAAVIFLAFVSTLFVSKDMIERSDDFFLAVHEQNFDKIGTYLSKGFKSDVTMEELTEYLSSKSMLRFQKVDWEVTSMNSRSGSVTGSLTKASGIVMPVTVEPKLIS